MDAYNIKKSNSDCDIQSLGGAIVVQDTCKYKQELLSQLQNTRFYVKLSYDPTTIYQSEVLSFLNNAKTNGWISQSELDF